MISSPSFWRKSRLNSKSLKYVFEFISVATGSIAAGAYKEIKYTINAKTGYSRKASILCSVSGTGSGSIHITNHFATTSGELDCTATIASNVTAVVMVVYVKD
jgi:hypothetical protein